MILYRIFSCLILPLLLITGLAACASVRPPAEITAPTGPAPVTPEPAVATAEPTTSTSETVAPEATVAVEDATPTPSPEVVDPASAATSGETIEEAPVAGALVCDPLNDFTLVVPDGWQAFTPSAEGLYGTTTLGNYTEEDVAALGPKAQEGAFPPGGIKVDISAPEIAAGSFQAFVDERIASTMMGPGAERTTVSEPQPYELASFTGVTYTITEEPAYADAPPTIPVQVIILSVGEDRVITIGIIPADSPTLNEALGILSTLTLGECGG